MFNLSSGKIYIIVATLIVLTIIIYLINYQIKSTVIDELSKLKKRKYKKLQLMKMKQHKTIFQQRQNNDDAGEQSEQTRRQVDMDSYVDPVDLSDQYDDERKYNQRDMSKGRLSQDDIMQRDLIGA